MEWIALCVFGMVVGGLSGILGIGGGVVIIPGLMMLFGFEQLKAVGTSLVVLTLPVGIMGAIVYYRNGNVDMNAVIGISAGYALGIFITAGYVSMFPTALLSQLFGTLLLLVGVKMILVGDRGANIVASSSIALAVAWAAFLCLRWVGKKYQVRPYLKEIVQRRNDKAQMDFDYHI